MKFSELLKESIKDLHLLSHPFYQQWNEGQLSRETLKNYAREYYVHVKAFPRYISGTHAKCDDINKRRILLENLNDEEGISGTPHPELWAEFAKSVGNTDKELNAVQGENGIKNVINTFMEASNASYHEGLASLYAYEYQVPEVAETKIEGLVKHYGVRGQKALSFFEVHKEADRYHRQACEELLDGLSEEEQQEALISARKSAQSLWDFLTSIQEVSNAA